MKIKWINKVRSDGMHNAFTGLTFFKGRYFLAFRHGERHADPGGRQVLMTSTDGEHWQFHHETAFPAPPTVPADTPIDSRDCYFLNLGHELRLHSFALGPFLPAEDRFMIPPYSTVQVSRDGDTWSAPRSIFEDTILWKPIFWRDRFWCAGYRRVPEVGHTVELYESADGFVWTRQGVIASGNECALVPRGDDGFWAFVRTNGKPNLMEIWQSRLPFREWRQIGIIPKIIQSPHLHVLGGALHLFGREVPSCGDPGGGPKPESALRRTKIWRMQGTEAEEVLELPSRGDTSYVGTVVRPDGLLLMSYYSQHEAVDPDPANDDANNKPDDVFVAGIEWRPEGPPRL
jgi:hypothetical protein